MSAGVEHDLKKLQAELAQLREDVAKIVDTLRGATVGRASEIPDEIKRKVHCLTDQIEEKPVASALTSFGVGLALGMIVSGRR